MPTVAFLDQAHLPEFAPLYDAFQRDATLLYQWHHPPLDLQDLWQRLPEGDLGVLLLKSDENEAVVGFWFYAFPPHGALELSVFYLKDDFFPSEDWVKEAFQEAFHAWKTLDHWQDFSFGIYGLQTQWAKALEGLVVDGCSPIGLAEQHILRRDIIASDALPILNLYKTPVFPYAIHPWKDKYQAGLAVALAAAFKDEPDALWDARFRSEAGARDVLRLIETNQFGQFHPKLTYVVLDERRKPVPVGAIFLLQSEEDTVNIPLFFVHPEHQGKGLAKCLMLNFMHGLIQAVHAKQLRATSVNATTNPVQVKALKVYTDLGFTLHEAGFHAYSSKV
jgi:GNAT superfamily N-acetyltransferase